MNTAQETHLAEGNANWQADFPTRAAHTLRTLKSQGRWGRRDTWP